MLDNESSDEDGDGFVLGCAIGLRDRRAILGKYAMDWLEPMGLEDRISWVLVSYRGCSCCR